MLTVRPELVPTTLRLLDGEAECFTVESSSSGHPDDQAHYRELADGLQSLAARIRAGQPIDLASRLETRPAGEWLIDPLVKHVFESAHDGNSTRDDWGQGDAWNWRYLADLAALAADIEAATGGTNGG
jgi:hypothetical protein